MSAPSDTTSRRKRRGIADLVKGGTPIVGLTAYTAPIATLLDPHVDFLLVGDSLGMVVSIAAFIAEPVMGTGGGFVPPKGYFPRVQEVLAERHPVHCRRGDHRVWPYRFMVCNRPL